MRYRGYHRGDHCAFPPHLSWPSVYTLRYIYVCRRIRRGQGGGNEWSFVSQISRFSSRSSSRRCFPMIPIARAGQKPSAAPSLVDHEVEFRLPIASRKTCTPNCPRLLFMRTNLELVETLNSPKSAGTVFPTFRSSKIHPHCRLSDS